MARLMIVSRSISLSMRLADQHDITEHPVDDLDALSAPLDADVLVLDVGDPLLAVNTVNSLREADDAVPVLLVSGYQPEWAQVAAQQVEGVQVVGLPITRTALMEGIDMLTGENPTGVSGSASGSAQEDLDNTPEVDDDNPDLEGDGSTVEAAGGGRSDQPVWGTAPEVSATTVTASQVAGLAYSETITRPFDQEPRTGQLPTIEPTERKGWSREPAANGPVAGITRRIPRLGNRPRKLQRHPNPDVGEPVARTAPQVGLVTDPLGPRTGPYGFPISALDRRLDAEAASLVTDRPVGDTGTVLRTADLVRMLHERAGDLYGVSDTAQVLADDVIERADADAAAILLPDGPIWRVSGGVGLRPLERRLVLEESHWLITEIGSAGRAVLIEDTDIVRQQLAGAPLAAWRHLLAVPVPDVRAIVVLARGQEGGPFTDRDLSAVIAPVREAAALLAQAVQTRRLARMLSPLREVDADEPVRRRPEE